MTEAQRAHLRILEQSQLVVRTHERQYIRHVQGSKSPPKIIINHRIYDSVMDAARRLSKNRSVIRRWLTTGEATYHYA